jgi:hypothetical protein
MSKEYLYRYQWPPDDPKVDELYLPSGPLPTHPNDNDRGETTIVTWDNEE